MGIYLGQIGSIELTRQSLEDGKYSVVNPSDVNPDRNRFSFDFDEGFLINGDLLELSTTDGTDLDFVDASAWENNTVQSSGNWYVYVDELGGIRLYDNFDDSLDGGSNGIVSLASIARDIPIRAVVRGRESRVVGQVTDYELNTSRETVDITTLSEEHRSQYSTLISGSGQLTAQWDYNNRYNEEPVHYLMQLVLRTEIGSGFHGKFYIKAQDTTSQAGEFTAAQINDSLWWEFDAIVTESAVAFSATELVTATIRFITTGPVRLKASTQPKRYLLQESGDKIQLEQDATSYLMLEEEE